MITDAQSDENESTPHFAIISSNTAIDAAPDKGRVKMSEKISEGIPTRSKSGDKRELKKSAAPDAVNALTATMSRHIDGRSPNAFFIPSKAPSIKYEK